VQGSVNNLCVCVRWDGVVVMLVCVCVDAGVGVCGSGCVSVCVWVWVWACVCVCVGGVTDSPLRTIRGEQITPTARWIGARVVGGDKRRRKRWCRHCRRGQWPRGRRRRNRGWCISDEAQECVARDREVATAAYARPSAGSNRSAHLGDQVAAVVGRVADVVGGKLSRDARGLKRWRRCCRLRCRHQCWRKRRRNGGIAAGNALSGWCGSRIDETLQADTPIRPGTRCRVDHSTDCALKVTVVRVGDARMRWVRRLEGGRPRRCSRWRVCRQQTATLLAHAAPRV
jgi:hypothetical protein